METVAYEPESTVEGGIFCCELPTDPAHLRSMRRMVREWAANGGIHQDRLDDLVFAVDEAASRGIRHSMSGRGPIWIDGHVALGQVRVVVTDYGSHPASADSDGLDLHMLGTLTDHMHVEESDGATVITMVWDVSRIGLLGTRDSSRCTGRVA